MKRTIFPLCAIGELVEKVSRPVEVVTSQQYAEIGIRSHGKGIFDKDPVSGATLGDKRVFWVEPDCFILNIVFAWERAVARTTEKDVGKIASHRFPMFRPKSDRADLDFLLYFFRTNSGKEMLELASPGGAGRNKTLGQNEFYKILIPCPPVDEQRRIVGILATWDRAIALTEKLLANSQAQRKFLMHQLLTGRKRLDTFEGEWIAGTLSDFLNSIFGGGTPDKSNPKYWGGNIAWASVKDMGAPKLNQTTDTITLEGLNASSSKLVEPGRVIIATRMAVGSVTRATIPVAINQDLKALIPGPSLSDDYLFLLLRYFGPALELKGTGSTVKGIRLEALESLPIQVPSLEEQAAISAIIFASDKEIDQLSANLRALKSEKAALLQQLLTGKRRVKIITENEEAA